MAQTTVSIRIDEELKQQLESTVSEFGMNITTAFTIFAKAVVRERRIPFEIKASDPFYSEENIARIQHSVQQLNQGKGIARELVEDENV